MRTLPSVLALIIVTAVSLSARADSQLSVFGDGYPEDGDACKRVGENEATNKYLDDSRDLVACPAGDPLIDKLVTTRGAEKLETIGGQLLLSVPSERSAP